MLRLFLQEANQPHRIDVVLFGKLNYAAFLIAFKFANAQLLRLLTQAGNIQQVARRIGQYPKTVNQFDFDLFQLVRIFRAGNAFVERQTGIHVRNKIIRQQGRHAQFHFGLLAGEIFQRRFTSGFKRVDGIFQQLHIQRETDGFHRAALVFTQQLTGAADLQVVGRQRKASAQIFQRGDRFQTLLRVGGHCLRMRRQQPGVGLMVRTPDPPAQLVQLSQAEVIRPFDDDGVRRRNVDSGLNDGGTHQHVKALVVEIVHYPLQLALAHLAVTNGDARFRHQLCQPVGGFLNIFNVVVQVIDLATAQHFAQDRLAHHQIVVLANKGFHRQTARRWGSDYRQIAHAAHRHVQGARDRRCGQGQNVDVGAHRFDALFVAHPEAVLFVNDQQPQIFPLHVTLQQLVSADQNINFAFTCLFQDLRLLFGTAEAGQHFDTYRPVGEAVAEVVEVLLGKKGGRHQHRHLLVVLNRQESGAHRHLGFTEAHVAAD